MGGWVSLLLGLYGVRYAVWVGGWVGGGEEGGLNELGGWEEKNELLYIG